MGDRSSYPSYLHVDAETKPDATSTRDSSIDSELPRMAPVTTAPRKAYMDLRDAIALLDETCPNQEPSPSLTPRTPRTPSTPHPRNKRARSKSSDNSSSYSNERLSDRSFDKESKEKKRPFLKKIGISMTEDKPFLAKLTPKKIIGKPYLEKIGPSKAVERPFLDKIGSSKTLDKFIFDTPRYERKTGRADTSKEEIAKKSNEPKIIEESKTQRIMRMEQSFELQRRRSGKGPLLKMYSFETEDLESTVQVKEHRDPLRGASLDDVLDSGPSSLPLENTTIPEESPKSEMKEELKNGVELLKCRVTTSEEIIFSNTSFGSDKEPNSWGNSPRRKWQLKKDISTQKTSTHREVINNSQNAEKSQDSIHNSPTKRPVSSVISGPDDSQVDSLEKDLHSPTKTRKQDDNVVHKNSKDEDEKLNKQAQFEKRGISSDNLLFRDRSLASVEYQGRDQAEKTREVSSEDSLAHKISQEYTKETFKQLQDKFRYHEIPTETYADFKKRTRSNVQSIIGRQQDRLKANNIAPDASDDTFKDSTPVKMEKDFISDDKNEALRVQNNTVRSVLKKQQGIDHVGDQELDTNSSIRRPKRRIFHEPSQETMDLLTELRKVKSLLKTPSWEKDLELDKKPVRQPKRILLTDKEFCLSVERENSIRRPSRVINSFGKTEEVQSDAKQEEDKQDDEGIERSETKISGPALFEKKCLSLDYADDEKPQKPEARAISLASARNLPSEIEGMMVYPGITLIYDSKSYSSDVFNTPTDEINEKLGSNGLEKDVPKRMSENHCTEVDIAIPIDQKASSPKGRVQIQGRTSDLYEIISPRSTPFRVKKRLGKISVEETVKPESFTLGSKVDCRSTVTQKRTKCFPL
ncbi:unnamed protein product [Xylocopa violacea]|uniref:Uncharacterized protein n=1 Tax=Xylocopa violacea TaxID=135666 RepID=A0ABP1NGJ4_XYLVO